MTKSDVEKAANAAKTQAPEDGKEDTDCQRCRGGGCDWCGNTGHARILMPLSDANDLDAVIHALGIEDSDTTPAEAVAELHTEIERLRARVMELERGN
jgi:hypothetical protein